MGQRSTIAVTVNTVAALISGDHGSSNRRHGIDARQEGK